MQIIKPAGRAPTVAELRSALDGLHPATPVLGAMGMDETVRIENIVTSTTRVLLCIDETTVDSEAVELLARIVRKDVTAARARIDAADILRMLGVRL